MNPTTARYRIPFNKLCLTGAELRYIGAACNGDPWASGDAFGRRCQALLEGILKAPCVLLTTSGTHALEMAALLLDIGPGDEVIVPSFTFASTASAFALRGARPVFIDIRPDTLNLDEGLLESLITPRTKAIAPMHYGGVGCEMDSIMRVAGRHGLAVVEDNAHGLFGSYRGRYLGTIGCLAAQSFHSTKNLSCGEGGALVVNDPRLVGRAEIVRDKGTDRGRFSRGEVDKYSWIDLGSSYVLSEILAAFLTAQLESRDDVMAVRERVWRRYREALSGFAAENGVQLACEPAHCGQPYHMFWMVLPSAESRSSLIAHLKSRGIQSAFHYLPLHLSEMGRKFGGRPGQCPVTERVSARLLRLPFYNDLSEEDQQRVVEAVLEFDGWANG